MNSTKYPKFLRIAVMRKTEQLEIYGNEAITQTIYSLKDIKITEVFAKAIGFSYELVSPSDGQYGKLLPSGNWTGFLGMLQNNEADMVLTPIGVSEARANAFHFSNPLSILEITFVTLRHERVSRMTGLVEPFSIHVWFAFFACIFIMPIVFRYAMSKRYNAWTLFSSTILPILGRGINLRPQRNLDIWLLAFWLFGSSLLGYFYAAVLLSVATFPSFQGIRTIKDLSDGITEGKYYCKTYPGSYYPHILLRSEDPSMQNIAQNLQVNNGTHDFLAFLENKADDRKPVFVGAKYTFIPYKGIYFISEESFFFSISSLAVRKDFCCKLHLGKVVNRISASGIFHKILSDHVFKNFLKDFYHKFKRVLNSNDTPSKLTMADFKGLFLFLIISHIVSIFIFLIEICVKKVVF